MFTKPSLTELLDGVSRTVEHVLSPALQGTPAADVLPRVLALLDRVEIEWPTASGHLAEDNLDIEHTLQRIEHLTGAGVAAAAGDGGAAGTGAAAHQRSTDELAERNRALKAQLVKAMETLDLPAAPGDPTERVHADLEVRQLLSRLLHRERQAHPATATRPTPPIKVGAGIDDAELARLSSALTDYLNSELPGCGDVAVQNLRLLAGGSSREAFIFDASWTAVGGEHTAETCVMLRQPVSSVLESDTKELVMSGTRRLPQTEYRMIRQMGEHGVPVPHVLWVEPTGTWLDRPFAVTRWIAGEADFTKLVGAPEQERVLDQYVQILAHLHTLDPHDAGVDFLGSPTKQTAASEQVELFDRAFQSQRLEDFPALSYIVAWLRKNLPVADRVSVVHGDFRMGNFMWDDGGIVAMLDWEQCHLGDRHEEISFMYWPSWTLESFIPIDEFIARYEDASGAKVDRDTLAFYRVFIELKMAVVVLTGLRSFYATTERQLRYAASRSCEMLRETQFRIVEELLNGGPTYDLRWTSATARSSPK